ncbi:MerR family transcriptional regulator [Micromonospora sonneratiae]|uniref:MerR family transcriptional regulator n=1 Tax=Micromonospora sonneratiae TaxID=1184706 RepID=A0ABW3YGS3_9ACTN
MRIAELSRQSRVPVPTIKYYLREGLLPPGDFSSRNQAQYGEEHVRRLRLIRALLEIGRLPIAAIRDVVADLDRVDSDPHKTLGKALQATEPTHEQIDDAALAAAEEELDALITRRGWLAFSESSVRRTVARTIATLRELGGDALLDRIDAYADAAERAATADLETIRDLTDRDTQVYGAVIGTILGDALIAGLRRLAQVDRSVRMFHAQPEGPTGQRDTDAC